MVLAGVFLIVQTNHAYNTATTTNTVSFSGQGKVLAKPDVAVINLSIVTQAPTSKAAQSDNSKKSNAVTDFLKKQNIDEKDIKTIGYNISPQYDWNNGINNLRGYQVSETLQVKVRDLDKTDDVLAGVVSAGANLVNDVQLSVDKPEQLKEQARQEAIKDAQQKAEVLQKQLGIDLGHIVNFMEDGNGIPPIYYAKNMMAEATGMGGGGPAIAAGENEINVNVTITYQIK